MKNLTSISISVSVCLLALTIILFASSNSYAQSETGTTSTIIQSPPPLSYLIYNNTDYGIEVGYPSDWKIDQKDFLGGDYVTNIVTFRPPFDAKKESDDTEGRQFISFGIMHFLQPQSLDLAVNYLVDRARFELHHYKTINSTTRGIQFDGNPAMKWIFQQEDNNRLFKRIVLGFMNGSDMYYTGYRMKAKNFEKYLPMFDKMIASYNYTGTVDK